MAVQRWPRKNDPASIPARQETLGLDGEVTSHDLAPFAAAQESLTGVAVTPVSVVGPLRISLGDYELTEPDGRVEERGRAEEEVFVPLAHTEGGLSDSVYRGARAVAELGGFRTFVLADRITRASCFVCRDTEEAVALARWIDDSLDAARAWLEELDDPARSRFATLPEPSPRGGNRRRPRGPRRWRRASPQRARTWAWSGRGRWRTGPAGASKAACTSRCACRGSSWRPSAAGRVSPTRARGSS